MQRSMPAPIAGTARNGLSYWSDLRVPPTVVAKRGGNRKCPLDGVERARDQADRTGDSHDDRLAIHCGVLNNVGAKRCLNCLGSAAEAPQITLRRRFTRQESFRYTNASSTQRQELLRQVGAERDLSFVNANTSRLLGACFNEEMVCPHCQVKGQIRTQKGKVKAGVSGGKATGALLTLGVSLWLVGLSQRKLVTNATCENCQMTWAIA
jgi:hypothetical protein